MVLRNHTSKLFMQLKIDAMSFPGQAVNPNPPNFCDSNTDTSDPPLDGARPLVPLLDACWVCGSPPSSGSTYQGSDCGGQIANGTPQNLPGGDIGNTEWEWGPSLGCGSCSYCSLCIGRERVGSGCANAACCAIAGERATMRRKPSSDGYQGDVLTCCRRSLTKPGTTVGNVCFEDDDGLRTCAPEFRGYQKVGCVGPMATYCSDATDGGIPAKWTGTPQSSDCLRYVSETAPNSTLYEPVVGAMVEEYLITQNNPITSPASNGANHDPFVDELVGICRSAPGACDAVLTDKCLGVTREQLGNNINLANLCGCFMADSEYTRYAGFGVDRICDPVCTLGSSVKPANPSAQPEEAEFARCNQSICVIDDVTVNLLSSVSGDITFSQACGNCGANNQGAASCRCFITDTSVQAINSLVGDVEFSQQCGGAPVCYETQPNGVQLEVDCDTGDEVSTAGGAGGNAASAVALWVIFIILIIIGIILLVLAFRRPRRKQELTIQQQRTAPLISRNANFAGGGSGRSPII